MRSHGLKDICDFSSRLSKCWNNSTNGGTSLPREKESGNTEKFKKVGKVEKEKVCKNHCQSTANARVCECFFFAFFVRPVDGEMEG